MLKRYLFLVLISFNLFASSDRIFFVPLEQTFFDGSGYPTHPDESLTPGRLCENPDTYRYPEKIAYCERNVDGSTKASVIREYDARLGYSVSSMNRQDFKIDHYIPLCMGGSNSRENLWPQHKSIYGSTDPIEQRLCEMMAKGNLLQREAIETIRRAKESTSAAESILKSLHF